MVREILALGLSIDKGRIGVKTALWFGLTYDILRYTNMYMQRDRL